MIAQPVRKIRGFALAITMLAIAACASSPPASNSAGSIAVGDRAAAIALEQVGTPYLYGGNTPGGFDCSGLVHYAYRLAGANVPRTTKALWSAADTVKDRDLRAGDLLFFNIDGKMSHVGMYIGDGQFVHAPQSGRTVSVMSMDAPFYKAALLRAGRVY